MDDIISNDLFQISLNVLIVLLGIVIGMCIGYYLFKINIYKGPDSNVISKEIYTDIDGKKYKLIPKICVCPISYSMDKLSDPNYVDPNH